MEKVITKHLLLPGTLGRLREVPWTSNLKTELQRERKQKLLSLVDPNHVLQREQFGWSPDAMLNRCEQFGWSSDALLAVLSKPRRVATPEVEEKSCGCEMPLSKSDSCNECKEAGPVMNCQRHMKPCSSPAFLSCEGCSRPLCWKDRKECYCVALRAKDVQTRAKFLRKARERQERQREREREERLRGREREKERSDLCSKVKNNGKER